jgi:hypothetical protein
LLGRSSRNPSVQDYKTRKGRYLLLIEIGFKKGIDEQIVFMGGLFVFLQDYYAENLRRACY